VLNNQVEANRGSLGAELDVLLVGRLPIRLFLCISIHVLRKSVRIRRAKCDEQKPSCIRCTSTGRKCDGYNSAPQRMDSCETVTAQCQSSAKAKNQNLFVTRTPHIPTLYAPVFSGTSEEQRELEHFRYRTAIAFSGYFESDFWDSVVLRLSHFEPSVRYAAMALSTIHESFELAANSDPIHHQNKHRRRLALLQYNESIRQTHQLLAKNGSRSSDVALVSCVLFVCQELMQYNYNGAINHIRMGLRIFTPKASTKINEDLGQFFSRILVQTMFLGIPQFNPWFLPKIFSPTSISFTRLADAWVSLGMQFIAAYPFFTQVLRRDILAEVPTCPILLEDLRQNQFQKLSADAEGWHKAFHVFVNQQQGQYTPKESTGIELLHLHYICLKIMLTMAAKPHDSNTVLPEFVEVISIVKRLLHSSTSHFRSYSFDLGIIGPLFYTATQCPSSNIRWEALALLKHPRVPHREGIWGLTMTTRIAQRLVEVGEELMSEIEQERKRKFNVRLRSKSLAEHDHVRFSWWALQKVK
jgi:hypothetical protein